MNLQPLLSQTRFVRDAGMSCPVCQSSAIEFEYPEPEQGATARMETVCEDCHARWFIEFRVTGYRLIDLGNVVTAQLRRQRCQAKRWRSCGQLRSAI